MPSALIATTPTVPVHTVRATLELTSASTSVRYWNSGATRNMFSILLLFYSLPHGPAPLSLSCTGQAGLSTSVVEGSGG